MSDKCACGWCGRVLRREGAETCFEERGEPCLPQLDYEAQVLHEAEMQAQQDYEAWRMREDRNE